MKDENKPITCRVCLQCDVKCEYVSLFEVYNDCSINLKIHSIANVQIKQGDGLPDRICPDCLVQLENAVAFKLKCEASDAVLHNPAGNLSNNLQISVEIKDEFEVEYNSLDEQYYDDESTSLLTKKPIQKSNVPVECDDCGEMFKSKCKLRIHWRKIHQPDRLVCPICKRMFKSFKAFHIHAKKKPINCVMARNARIEGKGNSRVFHCTECPYSSKRMKDLITHYTIHSGDRNYPCNKCPKAFTQQSSLQAHQEAVHKEYLVETTCQYCGKHIKGRNNLYRHLRLHQQPSQQCEVCKKVLKNKAYLQIHMNRHSGVKAYSCEICAQTFYTLSELSNHRTKVHLKNKTYKCDLCGYTLYAKVRLKIHRSKHTDTNVPCLVCGVFVENAETLVIHQKRHYERNYPCPHCEKTFFTRKSLNKHVCSKHKCRMAINKNNLDSSNVYDSTIKQENPSENISDELKS